MKKIVIYGADVHDNSITTRITINKDEPETRILSYTTQGRNSMFNTTSASPCPRKSEEAQKGQS